MLKGVDVSSYQPNIDWGTVKNQIDFAIIRLGYGDNIERQDDKWFQYNVNGCISNNIPFGVYIYSYAKRISGEESIDSEVEHTLRQLSKISQKPFCVYIDLEDENYQSSFGKETLTNFALHFCNKIKNNGYKAGVYANENWFRNYLDAIKIHNEGYTLWCARVSDTAPNIGTTYDIWQYSFSGRINGIKGDVDLDNMINDIVDYKPTPQPTPANQVNVYYRVKTQKHGWLSEVKNLNDYAGWENSPITGVAIRVDKGSIRYRVHIKGGQWLPYVTGYDINNMANGWAGNNLAIDLIEAYYYTPSNIRPFKKAKYRVNNYSWQYDNETKNGQDSYAGILGKNITKFQITIE